ncbi:MAG TPA: nuclear transport factor 2 family protein [Hypericibacter adhaerens]|uniref:nuclear transport factor 2 family protein n=1 Tax=Hypericibacter adhaerens TaxID=2602016 RepID=UPI002D10FFEC|nr:nuclear transport factor 2 family protein [Hypericibacter adhaerens]HWA44054.1 nuclear transport factor 2 family protein [Hypericibacter adhaerens]
MTSDPLPPPIARYFAGKNAGDFGTGLAGFSESAVVQDEGHRHEGPAAIRAWMEETSARYNDKAEIKRAARNGDEIEVTAQILGTFPGSPITLRFRFTLEDDRIARLEIGS